MKVKYIGENDPLELLNGKLYNNIEISGWYRTIDETEEDFLFPPEKFEIIEDIGMFIINETNSRKIMLAFLLAEKAHEGQTDKAGVDYIQHPIKVASLVDGENEKVCALLHDVMEDTEFPEGALRILFGDEIVDTLLLLTHRDGESYEEYIEKISESELATRVKIADLTHNSDLSRLKEVTEKDLKRYEKYQKSIAFLKSKLNEE